MAQPNTATEDQDVLVFDTAYPTFRLRLGETDHTAYYYSRDKIGPRRMYRLLDEADRAYVRAAGDQQPPTPVGDGDTFTDEQVQALQEQLDRHAAAWDDYLTNALMAVVERLDRITASNVPRPYADQILRKSGVLLDPAQAPPQEARQDSPLTEGEGSTGSSPAENSATGSPATGGRSRKRST